MGVLKNHLPTPSDRMGIIWTLCGIKEGIVLEYGPSGTTHYAIDTASKMDAEDDDNLFCTHITEDDIIMGDTTKLEEALLELDRDKKPKYIFIVGSSVTAIVAANLEGVKFFMQDKVNAKIITYSHGCFVGDYALGIKDALTSLSEIVKEPKNVNGNMYNIIGAVGDSYRNSSDINAIQDIMKDSFDMNALAIFPKTSITDIENSSNAKVNLVLRAEGLELAKFMKENYGVEYVYGAPYGYKGTKEWLERVSKVVEKDVNTKIIAEIDSRIADCSLYMMYSMMYKIAPKAYLFSNYDVSCGIGDFLKNELFFSSVEKYASHSFVHLSDVREDITVMTEEQDRKKLLKDMQGIFLLSDDETFKFVDDTNTTLTISTPVTKWKAIATHMPFMTNKGADYIREYVEKYISNLIKQKLKQ